MALPLIKKAPYPVKLIDADLGQIDQAIAAQADAFDPGIRGQIEMICATGGKRIRPALALLVAGATGGVREGHRVLGTVLELIHIASLVHDDIIDEAATRRGEPTANVRWGTHTAVLLGDALFAHALSLATTLDDLHFSRRVGEAARDVCTGEILQTQRRFDLTLTEDQYFHLIGLKTGALFASACELAAHLNGLTDNQVESLKNYGMLVGTAYQVYDDILDLVADEADAGKTLRTDLEKGKLTLPLLCLLARATPAQKEKIAGYLLHERGVPVEMLAGIADYEGAIEESIRKGRELLNQSVAAISWLPESPHYAALRQIADELSRRLGKLKP